MSDQDDPRPTWTEIKRHLLDLGAGDLVDLWEAYWKRLLEHTLRYPDEASELATAIQEEMLHIQAEHIRAGRRAERDENLS